MDGLVSNLGNYIVCLHYLVVCCWRAISRNQKEQKRHAFRVCWLPLRREEASFKARLNTWAKITYLIIIFII